MRPFLRVHPKWYTNNRQWKGKNLRQKKELDFDLNIISFIGLLAVCICFLLLTAIFIHITSLDIKQSMSRQGSVIVTQDQDITVWVEMKKEGQVILQLQNPPSHIDKALHSRHILGLNKDGVLQLNYKDILEHLKVLVGKIPKLSTGVIIPYPEAKYEDIISLMDQLKEVGIHFLGLSPI